MQPEREHVLLFPCWYNLAYIDIIKLHSKAGDFKLGNGHLLESTGGCYGRTAKHFRKMELKLPYAIVAYKIWVREVCKISHFLNENWAWFLQGKSLICIGISKYQGMMLEFIFHCAGCALHFLLSESSHRFTGGACSLYFPSHFSALLPKVINLALSCPCEAEIREGD